MALEQARRPVEGRGVVNQRIEEAHPMIEQTIKVPDEQQPIAIDRHPTRVVVFVGGRVIADTERAFHPDLVDRTEAR